MKNKCCGPHGIALAAQVLDRPLRSAFARRFGLEPFAGASEGHGLRAVAQSLDADVVSTRAAHIDGELRGDRLRDFELRFMLEDADDADVLFRDISLAAEHRQ